MSKFHITGRGEARPCGATVGSCPYGSEGEHYPSEAEASKAFEASMNEATLPSVRREPPSLEQVKTVAREILRPHLLKEDERVMDLMAAGKPVHPADLAGFIGSLNVALWNPSTGRREANQYQLLVNYARDLERKARLDA